MKKAKRPRTTESAMASTEKAVKDIFATSLVSSRRQEKTGAVPTSVFMRSIQKNNRPRRISTSILATVVPDSIEITRLQWNTVIDNNPEFDKGAKQNGAFFMQPTGDLTVSFSLWKGLRQYTDAILVAYVEDGALAPMHFPIKLQAFNILSNNITTGSINVSGWATPFPPALYGYHRFVLELWAVSPGGQPLPAQLQTNPPDPRLFVSESSDKVWLFVSPGCRSSQLGGLDWINLQAQFLSSTVDLDATGTKVAAGQSVSFNFQITSAGFAPTIYGYNGSIVGLLIERLGYDSVNPVYPTQIGASGTYKVDLSGLPFTGGDAVTVYAGGTVCASAVITQSITGKKVAPAPAALAINDDFVSTSDGLPVQPQSPFTFHVYVQNVGGSNTGPFSCEITCDNGMDSGPIAVSSMVPGQVTDVYWNIAGLDSGIYGFNITVDINHQVGSVSPTAYYQLLI